MNKFVFSLALLVLTGCATQSQETKAVFAEKCIDWVDPFIGTGGHGHTYPGATLPFGMVQLSPDTRLDGWDGCGGYHASDSIMYGFSHTHLQGTGVSDYGDILFMPTNNTTRQGANWHERYASGFDKETEQAQPGYYAVHLTDNAMNVELTATERVGIHRYRPDVLDTLTLFVDMAHRDDLVEYSFYPQGDTLILGHRISRAWAEEQHVYFAAWFNQPFEYLDQTYEVVESIDPATGAVVQEVEYVPVFPLKFDPAKELIVKVAISAVDIEGAWNNMVSEALHWDFDVYKEEAQGKWERELSRIQVATTNDEERTNFYSALYHSMTVPNVFSDADGRYRSTDLAIHEPDGHDHYTIFSLWDTFRATHPLYSIIQRDRTGEFIHTFLDMYRHGGQLPVWELAGNYTGCMIGYHSVPVIHDAYVKGINQFDQQLALEAMLSIADTNELGKNEFARYGFIPAEMESESVSKGLEYAYNAWNIADFAHRIGNDDVYRDYIQRAQYYKNIYNPHHGFMQAKRNGTWLEPFDPYEVNFCFTEANSFQYTFFAPQDVNGMIDMMGGDSAFCASLDYLFTADTQTTGREQDDITGLIGQYAHGNEPSHHMAYLYSFAGKPYKTQEYVRQILLDQYNNTPDGLSGNEDCGQMSSWYVLSSMGFYPVTPGSTKYVLGAPLFEETAIHLENGNTFTIKALNNPLQNAYVERMELNGQPYGKWDIDHAEIMKGGTLTFYMSDTPNKSTVSPENRPEQRIAEEVICPTPYLEMQRTFSEPYLIKIHCPEEGASIHYRISSDGQSHEGIYNEPIEISLSSSIEAWAAKEGLQPSKTIEGVTTLIDGRRSVVLENNYENQYAAGGPKALVDFLRGGNDFKTGEWQGYSGVDVSAVVDLGEMRDVHHVAIGALQDTRPWIIYPSKVEFWISDNGVDFTPLGEVINEVPASDYKVQHMDFGLEVSSHGRYIKVLAHNYGTLPEWHLGHGGQAWLFVDEIVVE
ncbi:MAG: GH92 family glycosyl hydrolase [Flavobacteriales bacterium]|nr:GH92 family glycosyl hydrolase [Flavobacteriales bacterium]